MKFLRNILDDLHPQFTDGGKYEKLYPLYEALDTFAFTPGEVSTGGTHVRDGMDMKRLMVTVVIALIPVTLMGIWNAGYQAVLALAEQNISSWADVSGWRAVIMNAAGFSLDSSSIASNFIYGALFFLPIYAVTMFVGGHIEVIFAIIRKHEINEGFLVSGLLFPLTLPATTPLWQVAIGIAFGVFFAKEVFGGTGKNFLNVALTSRAFLYFAYPANLSGDAIWVAVDGYTAATSLGIAAAEGHNAIMWSLTQAFYGMIPGSIGETSVLCALIGAFILILTGTGSWRIMMSVVVGAVATVFLFNSIGSSTNLMFTMPIEWHLCLGGFAFGTVFMATDPVSATMTNTGKFVYGALIGIMTILIRVANPAYPEGIMLAILFANLFAPLIDYVVVDSNIKRRLRRNAS
ncbi:NADH:ubiquinone reductase (Na(+)-transporting) subunit B [Candidatus Poribacteria bacterium]|nr:NADH:ubiquinone reductase (Na(+)-transporting) subunit B [Candidatus Poribacteria bacterium]